MRRLYDCTTRPNPIPPHNFNTSTLSPFLRGPPPKVIWIRRGKGRTADIEALLRSSRTEIFAFGADAKAAFLALS